MHTAASVGPTVCSQHECLSFATIYDLGNFPKLACWCNHGSLLLDIQHKLLWAVPPTWPAAAFACMLTSSTAVQQTSRNLIALWWPMHGRPPSQRKVNLPNAFWRQTVCNSKHSKHCSQSDWRCMQYCSVYSTHPGYILMLVNLASFVQGLAQSVTTAIEVWYTWLR